jgi:hypothetical protein
MAQATGFQPDYESGDIKMNAGDTGSMIVRCTQKDGDEWTSDDRMLFTIRNQQGEIMIQRIYRLDDQYDLGNGVVLIEFHNDDTDDWEPGDYSMERRYNISPIWDGTPSTARCVDALADGAVMMVEGGTVRTVFQGTLHIDGVSGRI